MTKISYFDNKHNWVGWFILKTLETKEVDHKFDGDNLDVKLTVDGVELDFVSVVESLGENWSTEVKREAKSLMEEKMKDVMFSKIYEIGYQADLLERELSDKFQELLNM